MAVMARLGLCLHLSSYSHHTLVKRQAEGESSALTSASVCTSSRPPAAAIARRRCNVALDCRSPAAAVTTGSENVLARASGCASRAVDKAERTVCKAAVRCLEGNQRALRGHSEGNLRAI